MTLQSNEYEQLDDGVMTRTLEGKIFFWNHGAEKLYGWKKEEAVGKVSHDLLKTRFPKPLKEIESELVRSGLWEGKLEHTTRDGGRMVVKSRWTIDPSEKSGAVVEINVPSTDAEAEIERYDGEIAKQEIMPAKTKSMKAEDFLAKIANIILGGGGLLCFLALTYFVYYYGWTGQRQFASWVGMLLYYFFPALLTTLLFASLRLRKPLRINLALAFFSVGVSIYTLETVLTVWLNQPSVKQDLTRKKRAAAAKALGIDFDARSKREVVDDLRGGGIDAVPSVFPQVLLKEQSDGTRKSLISINGTEVLPLAGVASKLVVVCNESGKFLSYRSDQHGFNNPPNIWTKESLDIVAIGDSFTQGWCVPPDDSFVALIRKRYPSTLNLGMEGNGPLLMLANINEYAHNFRPKVVLWFYCEANDIVDLIKEDESPLLRRYLSDEFSQGLSSRQSEINQALEEYIKKMRENNVLITKLQEFAETATGLRAQKEQIITLSQLRQRFGLVQGTAVGSDDVSPTVAGTKRYQREIELLGTVLTKAKESVNRWGGNLYFVYLPAWTRYASRESGDDSLRNRVLQTATTAGLPIIDIHRSFAAQKDPLALFPLRLGHHYNEEGHRLVAQEVLRSICFVK